MGLRLGCVLFPLLISSFVNDMADSLGGGKAFGQCFIVWR